MKVSVEIGQKFLRALDKREDLDPGRFYSFAEVTQIMSDAEVTIPDDVSVPQFLNQLHDWDWIESNGAGFDMVEQSFRITAKGQYRSASSSDYAEQFNRAMNSLPLLDSAPLETGLDRGTGLNLLSAQGIETHSPEVGRPTLSVFERARSKSIDSVPAANRVVNLDHSSLEYREISVQIAALTNAIRTSNQVGDDPDHRDQLLKSLSAASTLWDAAQLNVLQIKVGIIMAVEDAYSALIKIGQGVGFAVTVDLIKSFVKKHAGIDI